MSKPTFENTKVNGVSLPDALDESCKKYLSETFELEIGKEDGDSLQDEIDYGIKSAIYEAGFKDAVKFMTGGQIVSKK